MSSISKRVLARILSICMVITSITFFDVNEVKRVSAESYRDLNQSQIVNEMGAGWNLGNQFEASNNGIPSETAWNNPVVTENLILAVKNAGFKTIRIPVSYLNYITYNSSTGKYQIDTSWLERIREVVDYCVNNDIYAIINMHGDGYKNVSGSWLLCYESDQTTIRKKYEDCWSQIATTFKDYDEHLIFESMNEEFDDTYGTPNTTYYSNLNTYNQIFVDTVRNTGGNNDKRWLLIPGWNTNIDYTVGNYGFKLPTDNYLNSSVSGKRIMISVHYYDPWSFCGEASTLQWGSIATGNVDSWGQEDHMTNQFNKLYSTFVQNGYPVVIGEYGATNAESYDSMNLTCRKYWYKYLCQLAYDKGCVPVAWDNNGKDSNYKADQFGLFDRNTLSPTSNGQKIIDSIMEVYNSEENATATDISLDKKSITMYVGDESQKINALLTPSDCTDHITWNSSDSKVATVIDGNIIAVGEGSCTITAKTPNNLKASCEVTVKAATNMKLTLNLLNSSDWSTTVSDNVVISSNEDTYTFTINDTSTHLNSIGSLYIKDINVDTDKGEASAYDFIKMKVVSASLNNTPCEIDSSHDTYIYDSSLKTSDEFNRNVFNFSFINVWNTGVKSIFTNTFSLEQYKYAFSGVSLNNASNELKITVKLSDIDAGNSEESPVPSPDVSLESQAPSPDVSLESQAPSQDVSLESPAPLSEVSESPLPSQDVNPQESENPVVSENPMVSDNPVISEAPIVSDNPMISESPIVSASPVVSEAPIVSESPVISEAPTESTSPVVSTSPTESESPVISEAPTESTSPVVSTSPIESESPVISFKPVESVIPMESVSPTESSTPIITSSPFESLSPMESFNPTESVNPIESLNPVESISPTVSGAPVESVTPTVSENPAESINPTVSEAPAESVSPTVSVAPAESVLPAVSPSPSNSQSPDDEITEQKTKTKTIFITVNLKNKKKYKINKKVIIKAKKGIKIIKINGKKVKCKVGKKTISFKFKKYKKFLKKKRKNNTLIIKDKKGHKKKIIFKIK